MTVNKGSKSGKVFEYRVANWFNQREGWQGARNPLSGASQQIVESISKHDVRAWNEKLSIFLQIEAKKKTGINKAKRNEIIVQQKWLDKIDFTKDEILVFATDRSDLYAFIPTTRFFQILGRQYRVEYSKENTYSGDSQFLMRREYVDDAAQKRYHLKWSDKEYTVLMLDEFLTLRETVILDDDLSFEDRIKRLTSLEKALVFEVNYWDHLSTPQRKLLYTKLTELESGQIINPLHLSEAQFWLEDSFVLVCPHCKEKITKKDLQS